MQKLLLYLLVNLTLLSYSHAEDPKPINELFVDDSVINKAQQSNHQGIAAIVDSDIITNTELEHRYKTIAAFNASAANLSEQHMQALKAQILDALINEKALSQEAPKLGLVVSNADVQTKLGEIERENSLGKGDLLKRMKVEGVEGDDVLKEIRGRLLWEKFLREVIVPRIEITDSELFEFIDQNHSNKVKVDVQLVSASNKDSREKILGLWKKSKSCADLLASKQDLERNGLNERNIKGTLQNVNDNSIKHAIAYTQPNAKSYIFNKADSTNFVLVCDKKYDLSNAELGKIKHELRIKKVDAQAQRYMDNLKKKKYIHVHDIE